MISDDCVNPVMHVLITGRNRNRGSVNLSV